MRCGGRRWLCARPTAGTDGRESPKSPRPAWRAVAQFLGTRRDPRVTAELGRLDSNQRSADPEADGWRRTGLKGTTFELADGPLRPTDSRSVPSNWATNWAIGGLRFLLVLRDRDNGLVAAAFPTSASSATMTAPLASMSSKASSPGAASRFSPASSAEPARHGEHQASTILVDIEFSSRVSQKLHDADVDVPTKELVLTWQRHRVSNPPRGLPPRHRDR